MGQHYIGACSFAKALEPHTKGCYQLGVFALGWGYTGDLSRTPPESLAQLVWDKYPNHYKRRPREAAEMLELIVGMKAGDRICFRHRHKSFGSVIVALGTVVTPYFWDDSGAADLFDGHDCFHRVGVRWEWLDPEGRPSFPEAVWERAFGRMKQGRSLVRATPEDWRELESATEGVKRFDELEFDE